ncbi:MAG: hypothetical protein KBA81_06875 [Rhabdochlamydiaceae bacterium]|nr:hypothetical protein [Rhabdochlamydiaceae bacterium]
MDIKLKIKKHTPGPWALRLASTREIPEICAQYSGKFRRICRVTPHPGDQKEIPIKDFTVSDQDFSDALLIAAAPEMLEILEGLFHTGVMSGWEGTPSYENALAVIKKARGENEKD